MEKLILLLVVTQTSLISRSNAFRDDGNLVLFNVDHSGFEGNSTTGSQRAVEDFFKVLLPSTYWTQLETSKCRLETDAVLQEADKLNMWALKILDASAKTPSGILSGNLNQYGDFDECISSQGQSGGSLIKGKYCLASIEIKFKKNQTDSRISALDAAVHSHRMLTNELKDKGHRIPRFETFNLGICIPSSCDREDIETAFNKNLDRVFKNSFVKAKAFISDDVCYTQEKEKLSGVRAAVVFLFLVTLVLTILGTARDVRKVFVGNSKIDKIVRCFSLKRNWALLVSTNSSDDDIECIHGIRFLNALALLLSHKQIAMLFNPTLNRTEMSESFSKGWTMIGRTAILYTDSFILLSGLLVSYSIIKDLDRKRGIRFREKIINRIIRILPNLFCVILFCTYIMDVMGSGPQWGLVVTKYTNLCKKYMWRNFLFVHNYFGFENMCLTHTHQVGIDMQLFLSSPIFIYAIWKSPKLGFLLIGLVSIVSTWLRYDVTYRENLSTLLYFGISVEQLWRTANLSYIMPSHRLTVYLMGIFLGYYLRRGGKNLKMSSFLRMIVSLLSISAGLIALFGQNQAAFKDYVYDAKDAARFNAFGPILWTTFISWAILMCVNGHGGFLNDFLSWKYFRIFTRISYAVYLTQFPVFFYNVGTERSVQYYKGFHSLFDIMEWIVILIASVVLTLTYDIPFQELKKTLTSPSKHPVQMHEKTEESVESVKEENRRQKGRKRLQAFGT